MSRIHGTKDFWLAALRVEGNAFLAAVSEPGVVSAPVPSCPDWTVGDLVRHLGAVYRRTRMNAGSAGLQIHFLTSFQSVFKVFWSSAYCRIARTTTE